MKIVRVRVPGADRARLGVLIDDQVHLTEPDESVVGALERDGSLESLRLSGEIVDFDRGALAVPIERATSVRDFAGFMQHIRNGRAARGVTDPLPEIWSQRPTMFFVNPSAMFAADDAVPIQPACEAWDFEFEIAAVIGKRGSNLTPEQVPDHIAGYVIYCDWTSRDVAVEERAMQIGMGKAKDAGITLGPWILAGDDARALRVPGGFDLDVSIRINDSVFLETRFDGMNWTFEQLIAYASFGASIEVGDVIASGTVPGGCLYESSAGASFGGYLNAGDEVVFTAGPLGEMHSTVAPAPVAVSWRG